MLLAADGRQISARRANAKMDNPLGHVWPDSLDSAALMVFFIAAIALPALGYAFAVIDFRRWLRSAPRDFDHRVPRLWDARVGPPASAALRGGVWARLAVQRRRTGQGLPWEDQKAAPRPRRR